jgi:ATP-dependent exoDNAse (exonuclease V) alpha subunit
LSDQERAREVIAEGHNVFITGKAGTGKSTLLRDLRKEHPDMVVCAPTGMAAINVGGQTIHSLFKINPKIVDPEDLDEIYGWRADALRATKRVVIDEISMVRADMVSLIDARLRAVTGSSRPFGGKQMILFGDMFQLPPVARAPELVSYLDNMFGGPYFFLNPLVQEADFRLVELEKVYRQSDPRFINILNDIRAGEDLSGALDQLNALLTVETPDDAVVLTATNYGADKINEAHLVALEGDFHSKRARINGTFPESMYPTEEYLVLKEGARVMTLKNGEGYVNGSLGVITTIGDNSIYVELEDGGNTVEINPVRWENVRYTVQKGKKMKLGLDVVGEFMQYPLRLAWAMTIHKSQGQTFDRVHVDIGSGAFAHGQTYVALSRCRSLEGLTLGGGIRETDVMVDPLVLSYKDRFAA